MAYDVGMPNIEFDQSEIVVARTELAESRRRWIKMAAERAPLDQEIPERRIAVLDALIRKLVDAR